MGAEWKETRGTGGGNTEWENVEHVARRARRV